MVYFCIYGQLSKYVASVRCGEAPQCMNETMMNGAYSAHLSPVDIAIAESSGALDIHIGVMILRRTAIHLPSSYKSPAGKPIISSALGTQVF